MLETRQLHPTLAREIVGMRLWETLDEATVAELRSLYAQYGVLVFRRQALSEAELAEEIEIPGFGKNSRAYFLNIIAVIHPSNHCGEIAAMKGMNGVKGYPF